MGNPGAWKQHESTAEHVDDIWLHWTHRWWIFLFHFLYIYILISNSKGFMSFVNLLSFYAIFNCITCLLKNHFWELSLLCLDAWQSLLMMLQLSGIQYSKTTILVNKESICICKTNNSVRTFKILILMIFCVRYISFDSRCISFLWEGS